MQQLSNLTEVDKPSTSNKTLSWLTVKKNDFLMGKQREAKRPVMKHTAGEGRKCPGQLAER
ncbi:hypothetical protein UY3_08465 [Chelonia mydas]|uniref:Uncharacterized protein n=1 Tax=Chelonia mydas TaxID=8469 RepID=M7B8W8_CHEMY|nr:hypothetical protein UY3_08465 [Chelonia mydas]